MEEFGEQAARRPADNASGDNSVALEAWKAARRDHANALRNTWITGLTLGPASFLPLAMLAGTQCALPIDFVALGGASLGTALLWFYLGERCQVANARTGAELRAAEHALGQRAIALDGPSPDRMIRVVLAIVLALLWTWAFAVRPDCAGDSLSEEELAAEFALPR